MAQKMKEANKKFLWFLCCSLDQLRDRQLIMAIHSIPEFVIIPPGNIDKTLIKYCDYLVQLSDTESFCYSAYEALQRNIPVILTDFPEARNIIDDGENGFILNMDLSNLDVERIFNNKPKATYYLDRCNKDLWEKTFKGEL
jgi:glycosyltransferase involved in cell wall biosynthesis